MAIRFIFIMLVFYLVFNVKENFLTLDFFDIKKINITENSKILHFELTSLAKKIYNKNKYKVDFDKIQDEISKDLRVSDVIISSKSIDQLDIVVKIRDLYCYGLIKNKLYLLDEEGKIYGYYAEKKQEDIPIIVIEQEDDIQRLFKILSVLKSNSINKIISQIYSVDKHLIEILLKDGTRIKTNEEVAIEKYGILESLYSYVVREKKIDYIDIRFDNYIIKYLGENDE